MDIENMKIKLRTPSMEDRIKLVEILESRGDTVDEVISDPYNPFIGGTLVRLSSGKWVIDLAAHNTELGEFLTMHDAEA